jgi:GT2 family glycosyltransferase
MVTAAPVLSVVVPTRNRPDLAAACVRSILAQEGAPVFELILADQSDEPGTSEGARKAAGDDPRLRIVGVDGTGRSRALNAGIDAAWGAWIVVLDDDCRPRAGWLAALGAEIESAGERAVVVGRVVAGRAAPGRGEPPAILDEPGPREVRGRVDRDWIYPNLAFPRTAIEAIGLYDERLGVGTPLPGGEDNDWGYRLLRSGWRIVYRPSPVVEHEAWRSVAERAALKRAYGLGQGGFYAKHLARGDGFIAWRLVRDLVRQGVGAALAATRGRGSEARGHLAYLGGLFSGLARMARMLGRRGGRLQIVSIDLETAAWSPAAPHSGEGAYVIGRFRGRPVARRVFEGSLPRGASALAALLRAEAEEAIEVARRETKAGRPGTPQATDVGVVIATRNRVEDLRDCLAALGRLDPPPGQIVVADSASDDPGAIVAAAREAGARIVRCDRPGLSLARNAGAAVARSPILAFLDDDCRVDPGWLLALRRGFEDESVAMVTGAFAPAELSTPAQLLYLRTAHMDRRGFLPRRFTREAAPSRHWPLDAWRVGSGGNLAVRASAFAERGGFRLDLGLGTPARGGEDLFMIFDVIRSGRDVVYRPDAMVWHRHHRDLGSLRRVMYGYGAGHRAYVRAVAESGWARRRIALYYASFAYDRAKRLAAAAAALDPRRVGLVVREAAGTVAPLPRVTS